MYGSYDLPFGRGKQYMAGANHLEDLIVGGFQLSGVTTWGGGLPFTANYNECGANVSDTSRIPQPAAVALQAWSGSSHANEPDQAMWRTAQGTGNRTFYSGRRLPECH